MLGITGNLLSTEDKRFIRYATIYTMDYLVPRIDRSKYKIILDVSLDDKNNNSGECAFVSERKVKIWIDASLLKTEFKTIFFRFDEKFFRCYFHELLHAKQHLTGELKNYPNRKYKFKGVMYKDYNDKDVEGYYMAPYEMEARAYEEWLWVRFRDHLIEARGLKSGK